MPPKPDDRWKDIAGGFTPFGRVRPMSFDVLSKLTREWATITDSVDPDGGPAALLRMARSLFAHAWFDYDFMVVACFVGFQAMEAAFRELYPDNDQRLRRLVRQAREEGVLPPAIADVADTGVELRNHFAHAATQATFTIGIAAPMLENTHRLVAFVLAAADARASEAPH